MAVLFRPYVGKLYADNKANNLKNRLLLLGESFYLTKEEEADAGSFCNRLLASVRDNNMKGWKTRFFPKVFHAVTRKARRAVNDDVWKSFWDSVAYGVFIQKPLARSRQPPTEDMWQSGRDSFVDLLNDIKPRPTHMVVLSKRLWPVASSMLEVKEVDSVGCVCQLFLPAGEPILATWTNHPSSHFSMQIASERISRLLAT